MKPSLVIVGLGNPGASYDKTRHNIGFQALDRLSKEYGEGDWQERQKFKATVQEGRVVAIPILLVKPRTYMNLSGDTVRKLVDFYKLNPVEQIIVICDDVDIALGEVRFRERGGPGTHNGLKSVVDSLGEGFPRIRIGLGLKPPGADLSTWVLSVPPTSEQRRLQAAMETIPEKVREYVLGNPAPPR